MSAAKKLQPVGAQRSLKSLTSNEGIVTPTESNFNSHLKGLLKETRVGEGADNIRLTYGHTILSNVVFGRYDEAMEELDRVTSLQDQYPDFGSSAARYVKHAKSLVRALKAKRAVGKLPHVSRAKQKELIRSLTLHFEDLRACVMNIERIERQIRRVDLSSTRYFLGIFYWTCFITFVVAMLVYAMPLYAHSMHSYVTEVLTDVVVWIAKLVWPY